MSIYFYLAYISYERDYSHWATVIHKCSQTDYNLVGPSHNSNIAIIIFCGCSYYTNLISN